MTTTKPDRPIHNPFTFTAVSRPVRTDGDLGPMTTTNALEAEELAALMCARLCHDMASPLTGIGAALDVLSDDTLPEDFKEEAVAMLLQSGERAHARLDMMRAAFGPGPKDTAALMDLERLQGLCAAAHTDPAFTFAWQAPAGVPYLAGRIVLNLVGLAADCAYRGGHMDVGVNADGGTVTVATTGKKLRLEDHILDGFAGRQPEPDGFRPGTVQSYYTGLLARQAGGALSAELTEERVILQADLPGVA